MRGAASNVPAASPVVFKTARRLMVLIALWSLTIPDPLNYEQSKWNGVIDDRWWNGFDWMGDTKSISTSVLMANVTGIIALPQARGNPPMLRVQTGTTALLGI